MDLGIARLAKEFTKTESRKKQRFIKMSPRRETMADGYAKEQSAQRQG
jgi:hypothetical protein